MVSLSNSTRNKWCLLYAESLAFGIDPVLGVAAQLVHAGLASSLLVNPVPNPNSYQHAVDTYQSQGTDVSKDSEMTLYSRPRSRRYAITKVSWYPRLPFSTKCMSM